MNTRASPISSLDQHWSDYPLPRQKEERCEGRMINLSEKSWKNGQSPAMVAYGNRFVSGRSWERQFCFVILSGMRPQRGRTELKDPLQLKRHNLGLRIPLTTQVFPLRVQPLNQRDLLFTAPTFQLLLTFDGVGYFSECFVVQQSIDIVLCSEATEGVVFVLADAKVKIACNTNVERAIETAKNVDEVNLQALGVH